MYDDSSKKVLSFYKNVFIFQTVPSSKIEMWETQQIDKHVKIGQGDRCCQFITRPDKY